MSIRQLLTPNVSEFPLLEADRFPHKVQDMDLDQTNAEIQLLETRLCALKTHRNQLTFASRIPDDILLLIFTLSQKEGSSGKKPYAWMALGAVCQRWRRLLVGTPSLWTYLDSSIASSDFVDILLERSRGCLLDIAIRAGGKWVTAELMRQLLHRTRTLSMSGHSVEYDSHLETPAPFLEELIVGKSRRSVHPRTPPKATKLFFGGVAPKLFRVRFVAYPTHMESWAGLLTHVRYVDLDLSSWGGLIPAISSMVAVKELVLTLPPDWQDTAGRRVGYGATQRRRHHLPTLSVLTLHCITSACSTFLSYFTISQSARLIFRMALHSQDEASDPEELGRSILGCRNSASNVATSIQAMTISRRIVFEIQLWNSFLGERGGSDSSPVLINLGRGSHIDVWLTSWLRCADLWTIKEVVVEREMLETTSPLVKALEPFKWVKVFSL